MQNEIKISYPRTKYTLLNRKIKEMISLLLEEFLQYGETPLQLDFTYALDITTQECRRDPYLSYVFFIFLDTGGAHPDHRIMTLTYDTKKNQMTTLEDLMKTTPNLLSILSQESRRELKKLPYFVQEDYDKDMFHSGTEAMIDNFSHFCFSDNGLTIFFPRYQIAPYYAGEFQIMIPYSKLGIKLN